MPERSPKAAPTESTEPAPNFLPLTLHVIGTGCALMGAALFCALGVMFGMPLSLATMTGPAMLVGQGMVLMGLFLAGRPTQGSRLYWLARVGTALWGSALALDLARAQVRSWLLVNVPSVRDLPQTAGWIAWFAALVLFVCMMHVSVRAFVVRTWAVVLGIAMVGAQVWLSGFVALAGARLTPGFVGSPVAVFPGAFGLFTLGVALVAIGRTVHKAVFGEDAQASAAGPAKRASSDKHDKKSGKGYRGGKGTSASAREGLTADRLPDVRALARSLSIIGDAVASLAGVLALLAFLRVFAEASGISQRVVMDAATAGGELVALVLLAVATRRGGAFVTLASRLALVAVVILLGGSVLAYVAWSKPISPALVLLARDVPAVVAAGAVAAYARGLQALDPLMKDSHLAATARERLTVAWRALLAASVVRIVYDLVTNASLSSVSFVAGALSFAVAAWALVGGARAAKGTTDVAASLHERIARVARIADES